MLENRSEEYDRLRNLLMGDELEQLDRVESALAALQLDVEDATKLAEKILPMFDDLFLQKLRAKDSQTVEVLSRYIAQVIARSTQTHLPELSHALQRVISPAISREIAENQESMVDALYPIMGGLVSKYVSLSFHELITRINQRLEAGLTLSTYKRKLTSKVTGVSEVELMMKESAQAAITSLLVIHKESGLLVAEAHSASRKIGDAHMVASMASAIKDFINDWIHTHHQDVSEVEILSYGNATLYIESAGSVYIIAFLDAEPDPQQRVEINRFFARLIREYHGFFQAFDGDDSAEEIREISEKMQSVLDQETDGSKGTGETPSHGKGIRVVGFVLLVLVLVYGVYWGREQYRMYHLEHVLLDTTGQKITLNKEDGRISLRGNVDSFASYRAVMKRVKHEYDMPMTDEIHMPLGGVDRLLGKMQERGDAQRQHDTQKMQQRLSTLDDRIKKRFAAVTRHSESVESELHREVAKSLMVRQEIQRRENNVSQLLLQVASRMKHLEVTVHLLEHEQGVTHETVRHLEQANERIRTIAQMHTYALKRLAKAFDGEDGFNAQDGALDLKNSHLFAPGQASVQKQKVRRWIDTYFRRYVTLLLEDTHLRPYLRSIVIEGHTDSSGDPRFNEVLSLQRAYAVREAALRSPWSTHYHLEHWLRAQGLGSQGLIRKDGVEDKDASRRIRVRFELDTEKMIQTILKEAQ